MPFLLDENERSRYCDVRRIGRRPSIATVDPVKSAGENTSLPDSETQGRNWGVGVEALGARAPSCISHIG